MVYPYRSILVPIEFDDPSLIVLAMARQIADKRATLHLFHVVPKLPAFGEPDISPIEHTSEDEKALAMLKEIANRHLGGVKHEIHLARAAPRSLAKAVVGLATQVDADLIVLKTHGRKGLSHLILGSVAEEVVRTAPCPVLTLSPTAQERMHSRDSTESAEPA
jgi:nucleotide-binding universal stress UspA family protein